MEPRNAKIFKIFGNKYSKEQNSYVKPLKQMQHVCAMKNLWSANFLNFCNKATAAIFIVCKPVGIGQTLNATCKAASNSNSGLDVDVFEYNTVVNPILL